MAEIRKAEEVGLTLGDHATNAFQATLVGIPVVGGSLEKLIFGGLQELRMKKWEKTLRELGEMLQRVEAKVCIEDNEDFASILEEVAPALTKSPSETKRQRFRDLLFHAAQIPSGDQNWVEIRMARQVLDELDEVDLSVIASMNSVALWGRGTEIVVIDENKQAAFTTEPLIDLHSTRQREDDEVAWRTITSEYSHPVLAIALRKLKRFDLVTSRMDHPDALVVHTMTELAALLIKWTLAEETKVD